MSKTVHYPGLLDLSDITVLYSAFVLGLAPDDGYKLFQCLLQRIAENSDAEFDDLRRVSMPVAVVTTKAFLKPKWGKNQPNLRGVCRQEVAENLLPQILRSSFIVLRPF